MFSCEFCEIFRNTIFYRTLLVATSNLSHILWWLSRLVARGRRGDGSSTARLEKSSICPKQKTCPFWCYALNHRPEKFFVSSIWCRRTVPQHNFWFQKVIQLVVQLFKQLIQWRGLTNKLWLSYINWLDLTPPPLSVFLATPLSTFPHRI